MVKQSYSVRKTIQESQYSPYEFVISRDSDTSFEDEQKAILHLNELLDFALADRQRRVAVEREAKSKEHVRIAQDLAKQIGGDQK